MEGPIQGRLQHPSLRESLGKIVRVGAGVDARGRWTVVSEELLDDGERYTADGELATVEVAEPVRHRTFGHLDAGRGAEAP